LQTQLTSLHAVLSKSGYTSLPLENLPQKQLFLSAESNIKQQSHLQLKITRYAATIGTLRGIQSRIALFFAGAFILSTSLFMRQKPSANKITA
jgi:hypothetical protein